MPTTPPVENWGEDYDIFDPRYVADPYPIWDELRVHCPVAHSERWGGSFMPVRYEDVSAIAHDTEHFTSRQVTVVLVDRARQIDRGLARVKSPPITSDPPEHQSDRRLILPAFSPRAVAIYETLTRELCAELIDRMLVDGNGDGAVDYAQRIAVTVTAKMSARSRHHGGDVHRMGAWFARAGPSRREDPQRVGGRGDAVLHRAGC